MFFRFTRRHTRSPVVRLLLLLPVALALFLSGPLMVVAQTPTADQIQIFQNLPADQQQAILGTVGGGTGSGNANGGVRSDRQVQFPNTVLPRNANASSSSGNLPGQIEEPRLKAEDTLLLSLEVRQYSGPDSTAIVPAAPAPQLQGIAPTPALQPPPKIERTAEELGKLEDLRQRILRRNPYQLDRGAILNVLELGPIALGGLAVEEARKRIAAEPLLKDFVVGITLLPLEPTGTASLKPFGYDLFAGVPTTFAPATDVPVPTEYVVGPGDAFRVQLIGTTRGNYNLVVGRDGQINFPELGPIAVSGQRFDDARQMLEQRVAEQMIGTRASISMGELRSIRIFVLGEAEQPGSYTVSGLSTVTNALFLSGGVKTIGSLRNIELKRNGATVSRLDLYDLLLKGDTRGDVRLQPGDVIFIPPVGPTVGITGEVTRPATYELRGETTAEQLLALGGGLRPLAEPRLAALERIDDQRNRTVVDIDLSAVPGRGAQIRSGDILRIPGVRPTLENSVSVLGHVHRSGDYQFRPGMRLSDAITSLDELKPNAEQHYVLIRREQQDRRISVFSADLGQALAQRGSAADIQLAPRDRVYVFDLETGRDRILEPLLRDLRMQSRLGDPLQAVSVGGKVKIPGQYPLEPGMRVSDLIRAGGSLDDAAFGGKAELTRRDVSTGESRKSLLIEVDLDKVRAGDSAANILLEPFDFLVVKEVPDWGLQEQVQLQGEVRFPGIYPVSKGETLRSLLARAGGLTEMAFPKGSIFTRASLKERERQQIADLTQRMQTDLTQLALTASQNTSANAAQALTVGQSLLAGLRGAEPVGRLVIDINEVSAAPPGSEKDLILKDGDRLVVPRATQEVTVIGEVQSVTSHLYSAGQSRDDYIELSGGATRRADRGRVYVVRADGSVLGGAGRAWFSRRDVNMQPGDTVVVPLDVERLPALPTWQAVTQVLYNLAITLAAVNSF
jgi:polysaccharide export outer membrane protein